MIYCGMYVVCGISYSALIFSDLTVSSLSAYESSCLLMYQDNINKKSINTIFLECLLRITD